MRKINVVFRILLIIVGVLLSVYLLGVLVFWNRFPMRTYLDGELISFSSLDEVSLNCFYKTKAIQITLLKNDGTKEVVPFNKLGVYLDSDTVVYEFALHPFLWPVNVFEDTYYFSNGRPVYSRDRISEAVLYLDCIVSPDIVNPTNAYLEKTDGKFVVMSSSIGTRLDMDRVVDAICDSLDAGCLVIDLAEFDCYKTADIDTNDATLLALCEDGNRRLTQTVSIDLDGVTEIVPETVLYDAIDYKDSEFVVKSDVLQFYVSDLADKYNTIGSVRKFMSTLDGVLTLEPQDQDNFVGYEMNQKATLEQLYDTIVSGDGGLVSAVWLSKGYGRNVNDDVGNSYLEISIDHQHLWFYLDGKLVVDTDVTTGLDTDDRETPTGLFHVMELKRDHTMYGSYGSAFVNYFIRVTSSGVAIHDASWRDVYGGDEYIENGSHGCINTPFDVEQLIFETLESMSDYHIPIVIY